MNHPFHYFLFFMCLINSFFPDAKCEKSSHGYYKGLYSREVTNYNVVVPQRVDKHGKFISNSISHHYNKRSTTESNIIFYKLPIDGVEYIIELTPNVQMVAPGAVMEIHRKPITSQTTTKIPADTLDDMDIKKMENVDCHYSGFVRGSISSKAALSTCFGLAGFIQIKNGTFTIEPVARTGDFDEEEYPHILYRIDEAGFNRSVCDTLGFQKNRKVRQAKDSTNSPNVTAMLYPLYIETLIVVDKNVVNDDENFDSENYILTVFNMAFSLFHDASLGFLMKLSLVRIIRLDIVIKEFDINTNQDAEKSLRNFQKWQYKINPGDDTHPNHHDVAILITRLSVYSNISYGFLGVSTLGSACDKKQSAILCGDNGLRLGFVMAHEIAHLLGAEHDGFNNPCSGVDDEGFRTVMHPQILLTTETWSRCTQGYFKTFLEYELNGHGNCLYDAPSEHHFHIQDLLPGTIYDADFQCRQLLSPFASECNEGSTCDSLNCQIPGHLCIMTKVPPATGTRCGENMWCRQQKCLMIGERPDAIDGNWGEWSPWSDCSRTCGSGVSRSERQCNKPIPSHGGRYCLGKNKRHRICSSKPCDVNQPSFRDMQCGEYDDWIYPEDGLKHTWKEFFNHEGNPCILFCINENLEVAALKPRVIDGTTCYRGMRDICVDGICKSIPCDLKLESNAIEDICGVCHGDGTTCDFSQGQQSMEKFPKAMTKLITVPVGTRNIKVEEVMPSAARILVRDKETKAFYIKGIKLGMYRVPGSQAWLGMPKSKQEALTIPGPITRALTIWIERVENVTVKWSMALPATQQRKPEFTWDFVRWSPCSALCGPGTQKSEPSCIEEKAGLVENSYCSDLEIPPAKVRSCEVAKCETRWMVADWKECETVSGKKRIKRRMVHCVKTFGEGEGETQIVADEECSPPKPEEEEPCEKRHKRDSSDQNLAMFTPNRVKFGSHKKYDDYLKNFVAIATPERRSETIPVHILNTPHFKHYYRVLQMSDNEKKLGKNTNSQLIDQRSQISKNTYSGKRQNCMEMAKRRARRHSFLFPVRYGCGRSKNKYKKYGTSSATEPKLRLQHWNKNSQRKRRKVSLKKQNQNAKSDSAALREQNGEVREKVNRPENYTIRFGTVLVDKDEDLDLEIIFEEGDKDDLINIEALRSSEREKIWRIKGDDAVQFMENITGKDWKNKTPNED